MEDDPNVNGAVFRPSKRRRIFRRKLDEEEASPQTPISEISQPDSTANAVDHDAGSEQPLDLRRQRKTGFRRGGVTFSSGRTERAPQSSEASEHNAVALRDEPSTASTMADSRFTAPTGQVVVKDDKHMMAYIDAKMASIRSVTATTDTASPQPDPRLGTSIARPATRTSTSSLGQTPVNEITEVEVDTATTLPRSQRPRTRLGRDGKPLPPRKPRNARTEEDIARDALVERLLSENRMGDNIYAPDPNSASTANAGRNEDADLAMAEEFQRQFEEGRDEMRAKRLVAMAGAKKGPEPMDKGPKMGGGRSGRAAMERAEKAKK